ncbi:hypothetical protein [Reichenbachiella sp. MALMAid0571]|uniref:hypothetical protein n=1 Tax=Reichenbachiella sp. MALMAid0571 TaxID=3143939 RepID=UPI0032DEF9A1
MDKCISCECNLLVSGTEYVIEKALKPYKGYSSYSTIFEYAMCMPCAGKMRNLISAHSMKNINQYFSQNFDPNRTRRKLLENENSDVENWLNRCIVKDIIIGDLSECQVYAQCSGEQMLLGHFPYMVSGVALDEVVDLLSQETLDDLDKFKNEFVDGPSEFQDLLQSGPKVFF